MKRLKLAVSVFALAVALCVLAYLVVDRLYGSATEPSISLWYITGDCAGDALGQLRLTYNITGRGGDMPVSLRSFEDEAQLAAALETEVPDMLLCSYLKARDLERRGLLSEAELSGGAYPEAVLEAMPSSGRSFFPIGSRAGVLVVNRALWAAGAEPESFEALARQCTEYAEAQGAPFMAARSYADLINALMCSLNAPFSGELRTDASDPSFKRVYNLLAGCGYVHGLAAPAEDCAQSVAEGKLPCAFVSSEALAALDGSGISVLPLPLPEGGEAQCPAELMGVAVTCNRSERLSSVAAFLSWLGGDGRSDGLAMTSALVPLGAEGSARGCFWESALRALSAQRSMVYLSGDSDFFSRRDEFDAAFSEALDLLQ